MLQASLSIPTGEPSCLPVVLPRNQGPELVATLRRAAAGFGQANCHFRPDTQLVIHDVRERPPAVAGDRREAPAIHAYRARTYGID